MEKEGFVRSLQFLLPKISYKEIITDALTAIRSELGEYTSVELYALIMILIAATGIFHSLDVWHKTMRKALTKVTI